jgi:hypothetical protein
MQFLKRHYEKIVLCLVLLGLAGSAIWIKVEIGHVSSDISAPPTKGREGRGRGPAAVPPLDLTADQQALSQITNAPAVVFSGDHNLFNPVTWKRKPNGELLKLLKSGPDALTVLNITPRYTIISFDHASGNGGIYVMTWQIDADLLHLPRKIQEYAKVGVKPTSGLYIIRGIKGAADDPTELDLEIPDTGDTAAVTKDKPYQRVDGYVADLKYEPEGKTMGRVRVNSPLTLDGESYNVIEITANAVRVQATKTNKKTVIRWK